MLFSLLEANTPLGSRTRNIILTLISTSSSSLLVSATFSRTVFTNLIGYKGQIAFKFSGMKQNLFFGNMFLQSCQCLVLLPSKFLNKNLFLDTWLRYPLVDLLNWHKYNNLKRSTLKINQISINDRIYYCKKRPPVQCKFSSYSFGNYLIVVVYWLKIIKYSSLPAQYFIFITLIHLSVVV